MKYRLDLYGIDLDSALQLTSLVAKKYNAKIKSATHIGGWSVIKTDSKEFVDDVKLLLHPKVSDLNPFEFLYLELKRRGLKITFAESCTGGLFSALFAQVAGVSEVFDGALVVYSNFLKSEWLGVDPFILKTYGAVSEECVKQMCVGAIARTKADIALAISGIAGPSGGSEAKPVGTVFVGAKIDGMGSYVEELRFSGDRKSIQLASSYNAVRIVLTKILN